MAMSMRSRGGGNAANRLSRPSLRTVYDDFKPTREWKHEVLADILLFHLPEFAKEQIRIVAETRGILRIQGERHVTENKWSRFKEEIELPRNCNMKELKAKFEKGILQITMPKQMTTRPTHENHQIANPDFPETSAPNSNTAIPPQQQMPAIPPNVVAESHGRTSVDPMPPNHMNASNPIMPRIPETVVDSDEYERSRGSVFNKKKMDEVQKGSVDENDELNSFDGGVKNRGGSQYSRNLDEDKQLITNMGVAILVIFSLSWGLYIVFV